MRPKPRQRRADAAGLVAERALAAGFGGESGTRAERFQVAVHTEMATLEEDGEPGRSEVDGGEGQCRELAPDGVRRGGGARVVHEGRTRMSLNRVGQAVFFTRKGKMIASAPPMRRPVRLLSPLSPPPPLPPGELYNGPVRLVDSAIPWELEAAAREAVEEALEAAGEVALDAAELPPDSASKAAPNAAEDAAKKPARDDAGEVAPEEAGVRVGHGR